MLLARHVARMGTDLSLYLVRTGRWWLPLVTFVLVIATLVIVAIQAAVPTVVYTLF